MNRIIFIMVVCAVLSGCSNNDRRIELLELRITGLEKNQLLLTQTQSRMVIADRILAENQYKIVQRLK